MVFFLDTLKIGTLGQLRLVSIPEMDNFECLRQCFGTAALGSNPGAGCVSKGTAQVQPVPAIRQLGPSGSLRP